MSVHDPKKNTLNGNDSVFLYYFVQCTLKGKKKIVFRLKTVEREYSHRRPFYMGLPPPSPFGPLGSGNENARDPIISNVKIKLCMHGYFEFLKNGYATQS